jgi:hypothetical protein
MDLANQKEAATAFLGALDRLDPAVLANLISDDFEFEMMGRLPGVKPIGGKKNFLANMPKTLSTMFPNGLNMKVWSPKVRTSPFGPSPTPSPGTARSTRTAITSISSSARTASRRFVSTEYNDVNLVREVFFT